MTIPDLNFEDVEDTTPHPARASIAKLYIERSKPLPFNFSIRFSSSTWDQDGLSQALLQLLLAESTRWRYGSFHDVPFSAVVGVQGFSKVRGNVPMLESFFGTHDRAYPLATGWTQSNHRLF